MQTCLLLNTRTFTRTWLTLTELHLADTDDSQQVNDSLDYAGDCNFRG